MEQAHRIQTRPTATEWNRNDYNWDGDLFIATPNPNPNLNLNLNHIHRQFIPISSSDNTSSSSSDDLQSDRKRRAFAANDDQSASLALHLGGAASNWEANSIGKKTKLTGTGGTVPSSRAACQVQDCAADLSKAKDYHRRHKVCEMHSKATQALVSNVMQRFCQQCSRFHLLQEFDEGKRSCRRRLAGHNKRRRKTQPDPPSPPNINGDNTNNNNNGVLLITFLKLLSNMHANNRSDQKSNQELVAQLLGTLANPCSSLQLGKGISTLLQNSHNFLNATEAPTNAALSSQDNRPLEIMHSPSPTNPGSLFPIKESPPSYLETSAGRPKMNNFDLNDIYVDSDDGTEDLERSPGNGTYVSGSVDYPPWARQDSQQSSPPQNSGNSDSASAQSPASSSGEAPSRTDRIVFKLFGKEPSEFPLVLRGQIFDWLAHSPTEIESYIRPGCIILTVYLRLAESSWEELCSDLSSCLTRLFTTSNDPFWNTGWVFVRVQNQIAFVHNGQVVLDTSLSFHSSDYSRILSVTPVAVSVGEQAHFSIRGSNLSRSAARLLCALQGSYLDSEGRESVEDDDVEDDEDEDEGEDDGDEGEGEVEHDSLSCFIPNVTGRGFIEVEVDGLSSSYFPFIVAEKDVCSDIRTLENVLDLKETNEESSGLNGVSEARHQAMNFLNEMGWLLHRIHSSSRLGHLDPNTALFSFKRFRWLMDFSMEHDWCAVARKLLDILIAGCVGYGEYPSVKVALSDMGLLHRAVRRNCRPMVEFLLRYVPATSVEQFTSTSDGDQESFMFTPDALGPGGLTPLHVAAGRDGSEDILDALTDDPKKVGIKAWKNARDSTGATPEDYARLRGHYGYIHIVQRKMNRKAASGHVVVDIPGDTPSVGDNTKQGGAASFEIVRSGSSGFNQSCKLCVHKKAYYGNTRTSLVYRPAMLSMVAVAAVCVCVALLFKSMPSVVCLFQPFRWELLNYGSS